MNFNIKTDLSEYENICRYCLENKVTQSGKSNSTNEQETEQLLNDTFNLQVSRFSFIEQKMCKACVNKLKDGVAFKQQVLRVEATLTAHQETLVHDSLKHEWDSLDTCNNEDNVTIKEENSHIYMCVSPKQECDNLNTCKDTVMIKTAEKINEANIYVCVSPKQECDNLNTCKDTVMIKTEENINEVNIYEKALQIKLEGTGKIVPQVKRLEKKIISLNKKNTNTEERKDENHKNNGQDVDSKSSKRAKNYKNLTELRMNTFNLVTNSNMCLFRSRKSKLICLSCPESFLDIKDLKQHSAIHTEDFNWNPITKSLGLNCILSDISALTCKKCSKPCDDLNELREHLQSEHSINFTSADHILATYKLEEGFKCLKCDANFKNFNALSIHMNSHSTKNICDECGTAHINSTNLRHHIKTVHRQKVCGICKEVLKNTNAKTRHMRMVHKKGYYKRYCLRCDDTFSQDHQLAKHMTKVHGIKPEEFKCDQCDKKFESQSGLGMHVRSIHLGERKHACSECGKRFMTLGHKRRHELTHTDSKLFTCDFCQAKLKSKYSMQRHLKRLHGKGNETSVCKS